MNSCTNTNILLNTFHMCKSPKKKKSETLVHLNCHARHMHLSSTCNTKQHLESGDVVW